MSEVLVLIDHVDGAVKQPTLEMLTLAARLGEPAAVFIGPVAKATEAAARAQPTTRPRRRDAATGARDGAPAPDR